MRKDGVVTLRDNSNHVLQKFELVRGEIPRSTAILRVLEWFIEYDPNYLRTNILKLLPLTEQELQELKCITSQISPNTQALDLETTSITPIST